MAVHIEQLTQTCLKVRGTSSGSASNYLSEDSTHGIEPVPTANGEAAAVNIQEETFLQQSTAESTLKRPSTPTNKELAKIHLAPTASMHSRASSRVSKLLDTMESAGDEVVEDVVYNIQYAQRNESGVYNSFSAAVGKLDAVIAGIIMLNVLVMVVELEYQTHLSKVKLGRIRDDSGWENAPVWFLVIEHAFNAVFIAEIIIRFWVLRLYYFTYITNMLDLTLVLSTSIQMYVLQPLNVESGGHLTLFRMLRFCRTVRILKILRLPMFTALRVLVQTCISSMAALAWSMVLLFIIIILSGVFLCNLLKNEIQDDKLDHELRSWLFNYYGSSLRATYTLFEVTLSGCWPNYFRPLIEKVNGLYSIFAIWYISVVVFAVIRIITAIFLKQTLSVAANDADMVAIEQKAQHHHTIQKLAKVFKRIDTSGDGQLRIDEFQAVMANPEVKGWLSSLDLQVHDVDGLFQLLDNGDGSITYDEFLAGMLRLKGQARSLDVVALSRHCDKIEDRVLVLDAKVEGLAVGIGESLHEMLHNCDALNKKGGGKHGSRDACKAHEHETIVLNVDSFDLETVKSSAPNIEIKKSLRSKASADTLASAGAESSLYAVQKHGSKDSRASVHRHGSKDSHGSMHKHCS